MPQAIQNSYDACNISLLGKPHKILFAIVHETYPCTVHIHSTLYIALKMMNFKTFY